MPANAAHTTRRALFGAAAALPGVIALPALSSPDDLADLLNECDACLDLRARAAVAHSESAIFQEWERREEALLDRVEALPCTPETAKVRSRALAVICVNDIRDLLDGDTTDVRLCRQLVISLLGVA